MTERCDLIFFLQGEDSVSLKCEVDANPEAEITWRKDGDRRVLGNFPVLDIGVVSRTDTGSYSCTATNELGESPPGYVDVETYCEYPLSSSLFLSELTVSLMQDC